MPRKPSPEKLAGDDTPELPSEWFDKAKPASKVLPRLIGKKNATELLNPTRGRPPLENPKQHVNIGLDADICRPSKARGAAGRRE